LLLGSRNIEASLRCADAFKGAPDLAKLGSSSMAT
jgi:hypothetical protein